METTATDGKIYETSFYSLDAIIAVGYRVSYPFSSMGDKDTSRVSTATDFSIECQQSLGGQ